MPLDSGYVLIQPCVACWREPTAMSRLLRVSWLSAGRHSIPEKGTWTFRMDEAATGAQTGQTASQRARHRGSEDCCNTSCLPRAVLPEPKAEQPELRPQQPWAPAPPDVLPHGGSGADVGPPALLREESGATGTFAVAAVPRPVAGRLCVSAAETLGPPLLQARA